MSDIKVVLIDFDGVVNIADYFSVQYEKDFGISQDEISKFFSYEFNDCLVNKKDLKQILPSFLNKWKWDKSINEFLTYWFQNDIKIDDKLLNYIEKLRLKYHIVLTTQQEKYRKNHIWTTLQLNNVFDDIYCSCDIGYLKSDQKFYSTIIDDLTSRQIISSSEEIFFIDDTAENIEGAMNFGIQSLLYNNFQNFLEQFSTE